MSAELHRLQYRPGILGVTVVQGGFLGGWPRVGPHIGKELEEQGGGSDLETGKRDGGDSHVCLPASPMEGLPPPHTGHFHSLHLPFWETEAQRCKDVGQVTQAMEGKSQARNPASGRSWALSAWPGCQSDLYGGDGAQEGDVGPRDWAEACRAGTLLTRGSRQASAPPSGHVALAQSQHWLCHTLSEAFLVSQQDEQIDREFSFGEMA